MVELTEDSWRALARSSPWRWRTLHFTRTDDRQSVEAWVRRPGELLVRDGSGRTTYEAGLPYTSTANVVAFVEDGADVDPADLRPPVRRLPHEVAPLLRPDGLVAERPGRWAVDYDDPMYEDYTWVAMLDPVELSHDTFVDDVRADVVGGREAWRALVRPDEEYDPRCPCCPLLWSVVSDREEHGDAGNPHVRPEDYPEAYDVALDVRTGVLVDLQPIGGRGNGSALHLTLHAVDEPLDAVFAAR